MERQMDGYRTVARVRDPIRLVRMVKPIIRRCGRDLVHHPDELDGATLCSRWRG